MARQALNPVSRYELSRKAGRDIFDLWIYIAKDSADAADDVEAAIHENCVLLAKNPRIGRLTPAATKRPLLSWPAFPYKNYLIFYEITPRGITIVRVTRGERDIPKLLGF